MSKRTFVSALFLSLMLTIIFKTYWGKAPVYSLTENYTVPTRTPVPATKKPSSGGGSGGSGSSAATATNTPIPATATNTAVPVTLAATVGSFIPTAEACSKHPTIQAYNTTRVRMGPSTEYEVIGELVYLEVRPIIGRAADANWWQIMLDDNTVGWVSDDIVIDQGNISVLPIVEAPPLDGVAPTAGAPWNPTLEPGCAIAPVWTSTPAPTSPQPEPTVIPTETPLPEPVAAAGIEEASVEVVENVATETAVPPTAPPQPTKPPPPIATAEPLEVPAQSTSTGFLPIVAAILLAAGALIAFLRRNRG